jgi:hypothetical protein
MPLASVVCPFRIARLIQKYWLLSDLDYHQPRLVFSWN